MAANPPLSLIVTWLVLSAVCMAQDGGNQQTPIQESMSRCIASIEATGLLPPAMAKRFCDCSVPIRERTGSADEANNAGRECIKADLAKQPPFGSLDTYPHYTHDDVVSVGNWTYKLNRMAPIESVKHVRNSEFGLGDPQVMVLGIEMSIRNNASVPSMLPPFALVTDETSLGQFQGYIARGFDPSVVFSPGEELRGVVAFECCVFSGFGPQRTFLRVSGGLSGKIALIALNEPAVVAPTAATSPPLLLNKVDPDYPEEARRVKYSGSVKATLEIDEHGNVIEVKMLDSPGLGLDRETIKAALKWKFKPAMKDGVPVSSSEVFDLKPTSEE